MTQLSIVTSIAFACLPLSLFAQPMPNDPQFPLQWNLSSIGATNAWAITTGSTNVVVVVIDTGVDYTHPDLAANMWRNPGETGLDANGNDKATNGIDDDANGYVDDVHGVNVRNQTGDPMDVGFWSPPDIPASAPVYHGTFIAGIIGAVGNNGIGVTGLNWSAQIMAISFGDGDLTDLQGESDKPFYSDILAAFDYVLMMKQRGVNIRVVSNSYYSLIPGKTLEDRMKALEAEDILCVFAGGNFLADVDVYSKYPGAFNIGNILMVATSDDAGALRPLSPYGRSTIDLAAHGYNILSTTKGGGYVSGQTGTSFACPLVAGAATLLLAHDPLLTVNQLKAALFGSVDQHSSQKGKVVTNGRLNVARAFEYLTNANPPAIVITALPAGQRTPTNAPLQMTFNRPMNRASVESAFVIQPFVNGTFEWAADDRSFAFHHDTPFDSKTNYTVRLRGTAQDSTGGTLDGDFDRTLEGTPADDFVWTFRFPVPNDDFVAAQLLTGTVGQINGNNQYASWDVGEPQLVERGAQIRGNTVWYRWSPPTVGDWSTFDLPTVAFDSILDLFAGDDIGHLAWIGSSDNYGSRLGGRISFGATLATYYYLRVAGKHAFDPSQSGAFQLKWYPTPPPSFTGSQFSPTSGLPGTKVTLTGTNFTGATAVLFNGASASFTNALTNNLDLRITAVVPPDAISGSITIMTPHGNVTSTALFQVPSPRLNIALNSVSGAEFRWSNTNPVWLLEETEDLNNGPWTPVALSPVRTNGETRVTIGTSTGNRFYRLKRN